MKEDTSLLTDDDDDDDMEDLDALAKGLDQGTPAASPKPASAADTGNTHPSESLSLLAQQVRMMDTSSFALITKPPWAFPEFVSSLRV